MQPIINAAMAQNAKVGTELAGYLETSLSLAY
jgi:hypothetical protein